MLSWLASIARRQPLAAGVYISAVKTGSADVLAQKQLEGRTQLDLRRSFIFFTWGALYLGGVQYFIYNILFPRILFPSAAAFVAKPLSQRLRDPAGLLTVCKQVALDQFVHHPFVLFPAFYCVKEFIETCSPSADSVRAALLKYRANAWDDCKVCWQWWIPTFLVNVCISHAKRATSNREPLGSHEHRMPPTVRALVSRSAVYRRPAAPARAHRCGRLLRIHIAAVLQARGPAAAACRAETFYEGEDYNWKYELLHPTVKAVVGRYNRHHHLNLNL